MGRGRREENGDWFFPGGHPGDRERALAAAGGRKLLALVDKIEPHEVLMYALADKALQCVCMRDWVETWRWKVVIALDPE